jgi:selenophosphate synthetase-related protein
VHPDANVNSISVSVLGTAKRDGVIYSTTAQSGDAVIAAYDLSGRVHPSSSMNWDSVTMKEASLLRAQIALMQELGEQKLVSAGKDISNPGLIGTLGMLLEVSRVGAVIDIDAIPRPPLDEYGISFTHWLMMYPGMGFIVTVPKDLALQVTQKFATVSMTAAIIGQVNSSHKLEIRSRGACATVFDFSVDAITGIEECQHGE